MSGSWTEIREGFICPVCLHDLADGDQLVAHVNEQHGADREDVLDQVIGVFGAVTKFLDPSNIVDFSAPYYDRPLRRKAKEQPMGASTRHTDEFRRIRDTRIDEYAVATNNLIIRLDRLVGNGAPLSPNKRKAFEKEVVNWENDASASFCRFCAGRFALARRKHHCRLCGSVMCKSCSQFLGFELARKLTGCDSSAGAVAEAAEGDGRSTSAERAGRSASASRSPKKSPKQLLASTMAKLKRDGSEVSLGSFFDQDGNEHLRICPRCKGRLEQRDQQMDERAQPPLLVQVYERLRDLLDETARLKPTYANMAASLSEGESMYSLESASATRLKLMKLQEQIDFVSKKLLTIGVREGEAAASREQVMRRNMRSHAAAFLQNQLLELPQLPTVDEYGRLQNECKARIQRRIDAERSAAATASDRSNERKAAQKQTPDPNDARAPPPTGHMEGWSADTTTMPPIFDYNPSSDNKPIDPLQQQILQIKGYLRQAAEAGRMDEVKILEGNLREHESELKRRNLATPREVQR